MMSETELSVICKQCGSEVSPFVTECPYCGARIRKRAPQLERRDGALEPKLSRKQKRARRRAERAAKVSARREAVAAIDFGARPYATILLVLAPAVLMLARIASGGELADFGGVVVPLIGDEWWRFLSAPFAYLNTGYLFVVGLALAIFGTGLERRLGSIPTAALLVACGALGMLGGYAMENFRGEIEVMAGGNGMALGALAAWFAVRRAEARRSGEEEGFDPIPVAVAAAVLLLLPLVVETANVWTGLAGGAVGAIAGQIAATVRK